MRAAPIRADDTSLFDTIDLAPGLSITIPVSTGFQVRADGGEPLTAVAFTLPPWPAPEAVDAVGGAWQPTGGTPTVT